MGSTEWTFVDNLIQIFPYLLLALIAYVLRPPITDGHCDIREYYYRNARWFFGLGSVLIAGLMVNTRNMLGTPIFDPTNIVRAVAIALTIALAVSKNERFHSVGVAVAYVLLAIYIPIALFAL